MTMIFILDNWHVINQKNKMCSLDEATFLYGEVSRMPGMEEGQVIKTSKILVPAWQVRIAVCSEGRYHLGNPSKKWVNWLRDTNQYPIELGYDERPPN